MSDCLILSKNRPAQLDLLLASIDRYAHDVFDTVTILYTYDSPAYAQSYQYVRHKALSGGFRSSYLLLCGLTAELGRAASWASITATTSRGI